MAAPCMMCHNSLGENNYDNYMIMIGNGTNFGTTELEYIICKDCYVKIKEFLGKLKNGTEI